MSIEVTCCSDLTWLPENPIQLRYGQLAISLPPKASLRLEVAGQQLELATRDRPAQLQLATTAVTRAGIDFATAQGNQQLCLVGIAGECKVVLSSCRGPFSLKEGQRILASNDQGVRADDRIAEESNDSPMQEATAFARSLQQATQPVVFLHRTIELGEPRAASLASFTLFQLDDIRGMAPVWSDQPDRLKDLQCPWRRLIAQDSRFAQRVKQTLASDQGPLIYRLVCGFSDNQWSPETRSQLEAMLRHPEPAVRYWAAVELDDHSVGRLESDALP